jgi:ATP-dependent helicase/DNAse subunit B
MPLTLVLGPANSAKAREVLGGYADAAPGGAVLVVPTALDARLYAAELAAAGAVRGAVVTFSGLAGEIARRAGYRARRLTALQRERVLAQAVRAVGFEALAAAAQSRGFAAAAGALIAELERSLVTPQRFAQAMMAWAGEDERRRPYARDVAAVYLAYARELDRLDRVDAELYSWRALDALRAAPASWGSDAVFFYGFDDLHPLERDAVETLASVVGAEVTVSLTYEAGRAALAARAEAVEELRAVARRVHELPARDDYYEPKARHILHHIERQLFEPAPERADPGPAVRLLEAGGERAEIELVAAEVISLLEDGLAAEEIAVVYRSLGRVAPLLGRVFEEYGIPIAIDYEVPFGHTTLGHGLLALARCGLLEEHEVSATDLIQYLRMPGMLERLELADRLEAEVRREGLTTLAQARERFEFALEEIDVLRQAADAAPELARQGRRLLAAPNRRQAPVLSPDEQLDARALATMLRAFDELAELSARPLPGRELVELLETLRVPAGSPVRPGAVVVSEPLPLRAQRFQAVFVCGLEEGKFPLPPAPEPFLSDEHRRELALASGLRLRPSEDALARERYLLYASLSRATERVTLSYRSSDEEGNIVLPSPFLADVEDLLPDGWAQTRRRRLLADVVWPEGEAPTSRELARSRAAAGAPVAGELPSPITALTEVALAHVRHREMVSGGALEAYGDCPVKWLVERELQPAALEPDPDPLARGSYMHAALEEVLRRLERPVTPESLPDALRMLTEVLADMPPALAPGRPEGVRAAALRSIEADLRRYLEHEAGDECQWQPQAVELRFGFEDGEDSLPTLELGGLSERVRVRGAIDRIDVEPGGARAIVRDYKSGSVRPEYQGARWSTDRRLQVALYMLAVRELLGLEPVAGLYQPLAGGDLRARGLYLSDAEVGSCLVGTDARAREDLQAELDDAAARAIALATRLRTGELTPCPETCSRDGCRYPAICRIQ